MMRLHIGSGKKRIPGYSNVDADEATGPDLVAPMGDLAGVETDSVYSIYACHVLEHAHRLEVAGVLSEWKRVLRPGGELRVAVPDFDRLAFLYIYEGVHLERIWGLFYGGNKNEWDRHQVIFDYETLCTYLQRAGFHSMARYEGCDWIKQMVPGYDDYSDAEINGQYISLNVRAVAK